MKDLIHGMQVLSQDQDQTCPSCETYGPPLMMTVSKYDEKRPVDVEVSVVLDVPTAFRVRQKPAV